MHWCMCDAQLSCFASLYLSFFTVWTLHQKVLIFVSFIHETNGNKDECPGLKHTFYFYIIFFLHSSPNIMLLLLWFQKVFLHFLLFRSVIEFPLKCALQEVLRITLLLYIFFFLLHRCNVWFIKCAYVMAIFGIQWKYFSEYKSQPCALARHHFPHQLFHPDSPVFGKNLS